MFNIYIYVQFSVLELIVREDLWFLQMFLYMLLYILQWNIHRLKSWNSLNSNFYVFTVISSDLWIFGNT